MPAMVEACCLTKFPVALAADTTVFAADTTVFFAVVTRFPPVSTGWASAWTPVLAASLTMAAAWVGWAMTFAAVTTGRTVAT